MLFRSVAGLLNALHHDELHALFTSRRQSLDRQYQDLDDQSAALEKELAHGWADLKEAGVRLSDPLRPIRRSLWGASGIIGESMAHHLHGLALSREQRREDKLAKQRIAIRHEARELIRLERELEGVPYFLKGIGLDLQQFKDGETLPNNPPPVVSTDPMDGRYRLDMPFYLLPADPPARRRLFRAGAGAA